MSLFKYSGTALVFAFLLISCGPGIRGALPSPLPKIPAWHLLLDGDSFPERWQVDPCTLSPDCFGENEAYRIFGIVGVPGHVVQDVYRFETEDAAKARYRAYRESGVFGKSRQEPSTEFVPPPEIAWTSSIADEYYLACGVDIVPACRALFRYRTIVIMFYFDLDSGKGDGLQIQQVEPILHAMDEKASEVLGIPLPTKLP